jgi:hypothetical protein
LIASVSLSLSEMAAAAVAPPDEKFLKLKEENERRRK